MDRGLWRTYLGLGGLAVGYFLLLPDGLASDLTYLAIGLSSGLAILLGVRRNRPVRARAWQLMAAGELLWVLGDAVDTWYNDIAHSYPVVSAADVLYLAAYPVLGFGLLLLIRNDRAGRDWAGLLDSAIVTAGLGLLSWVLVGRPTLLDATGPLTDRLVGLAYPVGDILLVALLVRLVSMPGARSASFRLLAGALTLVIIADTGYAYANLHDLSTYRLFEVLWLGSYLAWGAAALHPSSQSLAGVRLTGNRPFGNLRLTALAAATLIAPGTLAVELARGDRLDAWAVVISSIALFGLVVARMRLSLSEIADANAQKDKLQDELAYEAAHDYLTRLPNRSQAVRQIEAALFRAQRSGSMIGLLFVDLDHFKIVNDTFGHRTGDEVLREVATRMADQVRGGDMVARLGGDEFVVLLEPVDSESSVVELGQRIIRAVSAPISTGGRHVSIGASVGVAVNLDGGTNADHLLGEADAAAYRAKSSGRGRVEVFDNALRRELSDRTALEAAIVAGVPNEEFELHYQPVVDIESGRVLGFEALIRWNRPGFGLVAPDEFIPTAEQSQLICGLGRWVLARATSQLALAQDSSLTVAVNISGRHLASSHIIDDVQSALAASGLDPRRLTVELTETMIIDDPTATEHLSDLRRLGVSISIDDFGTGYTSISQLRHLPVDSVKIDRSFMAPGQANAGQLVNLMVNAAHAFGLRVIAEGVEDPDQLSRLREMGCDAAQGYLLGRPMPAHSILELAASSTAVTPLS